ncbi:MAG: PfkB family carbohydrate kinase [Candidatus Acidiferrales bacterium]
MRATTKRVDVVGVGLNATDTIIRLPHFPAFDTKVELLSADIRAGGQVASAMVACQRWGLRTRYIGTVGDDAAAEFQAAELKRERVEAHLFSAPNCPSQIAYILVDEQSGERTIIWKRDRRLELRADQIRKEWITRAQALLVDAHDTEAAAAAGRIAREAGIPVVADIDNLYPGVQAALEQVDFLFASKDFPARLTGENDLLKALPEIHGKFKYRLTGATLGNLGAIAWDGDKFLLCPGFQVKAEDTTGAGDIFHGAIVYGLLKSWTVQRMLEFSCAAAALACTAVGARAGIASVRKIENLMRCGARSEAAYRPEQLKSFRRSA